ncbi:hypothetical protein PAAG_01809 [Paracoccidioides lutzii Pb01]|uniref:Uncharacterized protein n=1 Tax=Paracoccidioides lutzii (strain ATCC MYA-826 / Pb01) TaxID=502779 RepID=C1GTG4_PARBA|nr:hypothetical protein PAAG_01809 [Paracoccidioides lutzii Pb01]EEH39620.2 hypothetical protein PAAG_01809 [Paracoccidioides lutzii Pb01]
MGHSRSNKGSKATGQHQHFVEGSRRTGFSPRDIVESLDKQASLAAIAIVSIVCHNAAGCWALAPPAGPTLGGSDGKPPWLREDPPRSELASLN